MSVTAAYRDTVTVQFWIRKIIFLLLVVGVLVSKKIWLVVVVSLPFVVAIFWRSVVAAATSWLDLRPT